MLNAYALPPQLLDLTVSRICTRFTRFQTRSVLSVRHAHAAARLAPSNAVGYEPPPFDGNLNRSIQDRAPGLLTPRPRGGQGIAPKSELERRVKALEEIADDEGLPTEAFYSENDLLALYEDLLTLPAELQATPTPSAQPAVSEEEIMRCLGLVDSAEVRLAAMGRADSVEVDNAELEQEWIHSEDFLSPSAVDVKTPSYRRVLGLASEVLQVDAEPTAVQDVALRQKFPLSVMGPEEWDAVVKLAVHSSDGVAALETLTLIKRCGLVVPEEMLDSVLSVYTRAGDVVGFEKALSRFALESPTEHQRHLHIKTHLKATALEELPESALSVLHNYENQALPAPMKTYTSVIKHLFGTRSSAAKAHGWDLFSHMRYAAHSTPDAHLYAQMIRACASPIHSGFSSEPERALDLWQEMREKNILPTVDSYNAAILACTRSGEKSYVAEGFRLAKEMLDAHRDARGRQAFRPDRQTFCALLEGAKRIGDLARARWILAEMVRMSGQEGAEDLTVDEEVMTHVFHAYASYNPPFTRNLARLVDGGSGGGTERASHDGPTAMEAAETRPEVDASEQSFRHLAPQTKSEVLGEVDSLLEQIHLESQSSVDPNLTLKFRDIRPSNRLLNAYLSVHYRHNSFEKSRGVFWGVFERFGIKRNPRTYLEAMNKCAHVGRQDRDAAHGFAREIMEQWETLEDSDAGSKLDGRVVERMHVLYIRVLSHLDAHEGLTHLRRFATRYPPASLRSPPPKSNLQSTRTSLVASRPLVRLSSPIEVPDDAVPPFVTFRDLEFLHHKLLVAGDIKGMGYIKFLTKSYEWALRVRRDERTRLTPA